MEDLRPRTLPEIVGQPAVMGRLIQLAAGARAGRIVPPNLLFHGPPGIGKTTAARAFAREVLGEEWENSFHLLAAYDDRGVNVMARRIIPESRRPASREAPFRIIFFDDADGISPKAQNALRPALENPGGSTQFIFAVNDLRRMSYPLQSRCTVLPFGPLDGPSMRSVLLTAIAKTSFGVPEARLEGIISRSRGIPREGLKLLLEEAAGTPRIEESRFDPGRSGIPRDSPGAGPADVVGE
jgi:replication factor C small subunit